MLCELDDAVVHYAEHGSGVPLVALHGAGVDHRELAAALEPALPPDGYRRIYVDLPGMGRSTTGGLASNDDVVALLAAFIERVASQPVLVLGHSYGAYLARGLAAQRPDLVRGLALICPIGERTGAVPDHDAVRQDATAYDDLDAAERAGFDAYFVVRTPETARRYREHVLPGTKLVDEQALEKIFADWPVDVGSGTFSPPTLLAAGRCDSVVGYADATGLLERYPHATLAVVENAGHALMHERPDLLTALLADWLDRVPAVSA